MTSQAELDQGFDIRFSVAICTRTHMIGIRIRIRANINNSIISISISANMNSYY